MRIDRDTPICGVKPVLLKALMRHERFDTPRAMLMLGLEEPKVSETLYRLAEEGWVSWEGDREHVDRWRSMPLGHRLAASRLIRRFPIEQGRALLPKIIEAARSVNTNAEASHRIGEIFLFGSILTGADDGDAGDIDLVVHVNRRRLPDDRLSALIAAEEQRMPRHLDFYRRLNRQAEDLQRAIKKVSSKISLHGFSDVETYGAPHRLLYRYDVETEAEMPADPKIRVAKSQARPDPEREHRLPPPRNQRAWPVAPNAPVILRPMDATSFRLAQHLWMKGLGARQVARRLNLPEQAVAGYLASRAHANHNEPPRFDVSLDWMIDQACKPPRDHAVVVSIAKRHEADVTIECEALDLETFDRRADIRIFGGSDKWVSGRCDLQPLLEPVAQAASIWWERMRSQFVGLDVRIFTVRASSYRAAESVGSNRPDLRPLVSSMRDLLARLLPRPWGREAWHHKLELVRERGRDRLLHVTGGSRHAGSAATLITRRDEPRVWRQIKAVLEPQADIVQSLGDFTLGVDALHIEGVAEKIRSSYAGLE